jgi:hypothetical protein
MNSAPILDQIESDVLRRIAEHRSSRQAAHPVALALILTAVALGGGLAKGMAGTHRPPSHPGCEAALLADEIRLAPSSLLASRQ